MAEYKHSVSLDPDKCKACTHCLKRCPTEAIRVRSGHAIINSERCIDCGQCIRYCPHNAKQAVFDSLDSFRDYRYKIALPPPSLCGQFENLDDVDVLLQGLLDWGFDDVFEVARAAELVTEYTRRYLRQPDVKRPVISSACPVITRLIQLRFPFLLDNIMDLLPPIEIAASQARLQAKAKHPELTDEDICVVFISPCPAKVSYVKNQASGEPSAIDFVVSMSDMYFALLDVLKHETVPVPVSRTGMIGLSWASTGGESSALLNDRYLAADGIENVIRVLDEMEVGSYPYLDFVELNACDGGCVGGVMAVENPYIARVRLQSIRRYLPVSQYRPDNRDSDDIPEKFLMPQRPQHDPALRIHPDRRRAMELMAQTKKVFSELPELDCGFCGAPSCRAFAEDVVRGTVSADACVLVLKAKYEKGDSDDGGTASGGDGS